MPTTSPSSDQRQARVAFRRAAAVLPWFDPTTLEPAGLGEDPQLGADYHLAEDCITHGAAGAARWSLNEKLRHEVLSGIDAPEELLSLLAANPGQPDEQLHQTLVALLRHQAEPVKSLPRQALSTARTAIAFLAALPVKVDLPELSAIDRLLEQAALLEPLRKLAGPSFVGRESELQELRRYVGVADASLTETVGGWWGDQLFKKKGALLLHGQGGIGKSSVIAKFLLEHAELDEDQRFPFAYLDFEEQALEAESPLTLLDEMSRQLCIQYPEAEDSVAALRDQIADALDQDLLLQPRGPQAVATLWGGRDPIGRYLRDVELRAGRQQQLIERFAEIVAEAAEAPRRKERPLLVVLDSFEEVQYRSAARLQRLWRFLGVLQDSYPALRMVLGGRAPVEAKINKRKIAALEIEGLDTDSGVALLVAAGVADRELARTVAKQVGSSPLTLHLAAGVLAQEGGDQKSGIRDLKTLWLRLLAPERIQGHLFRRILGHIHNPDVRRLAHPGLVLRRITARNIHEVLAEPCGVEVADLEQASFLLDELQREVSLVTLEPDGSLRHRPDVRRTMLSLLEEDKPELVRQIEEAAVAFYSSSDKVTDRAEEIYHSLRLGRPLYEIDSRWIPGVELYLSGALDELPSAGKSFLASRLGLDLDTSERKKPMVLDVWERLVAEQAEGLLRDGFAKKALKLIRRRSRRSSSSPLFRLESLALSMLGQHEEAAAKIAEGLTKVSPLVAPEVVLRLRPLAAMSALSEEDLSVADEHLESAELLADELELPIEEISFRLGRLRLRRSEGFEEGDAASELEEEISALYLDLPEDDLLENPELARTVAAAVGASWPKVIHQFIEVFGVPETEKTDRDRLAYCLDTAIQQDESAASSATKLAFRLGIQESTDHKGAPYSERLVERASRDERLEDLVEILLESKIGSTQATTTVTEIVAGFFSKGNLWTGS